MYAMSLSRATFRCQTGVTLKPNTHRRRDSTVESRRYRRCVYEVATSSRRLPTDSADNLETEHIAG